MCQDMQLSGSRDPARLQRFPLQMSMQSRYAGLHRAVLDYYRCPEYLLAFALAGELSSDVGYFQFGPDVTLYGQSSVGSRASRVDGGLYDTMSGVTTADSAINLPFNPTDVINNLRCEYYSAHLRLDRSAGILDRVRRRAYYFGRPLLPLFARARLQRLWLRKWHELLFPAWPVDCTVETLLQKLLILWLKAQKQVTELPFVWFWPAGAASCLLMTHDVEHEKGVRWCSWLMDADKDFGITASFQLIPEQRYAVTQSLLNSVRTRGFEVAVHDLNHDGHLFENRDKFIRRADKINYYGHQYEARGFRSGAMYRNEDWFDVLDFEYDMSVPNVAHLDPQRGGCCTVMPYFIGKLLELPVTVAQDYHVFHILGDYSIDLWKRQIELIMEKHGLIHFIVHPDYLDCERARTTYIRLLEHVSRLRDEHKIWVAPPHEVNSWWRERAAMSIAPHNDTWMVTGPGSQRASLSYAFLQNGRIEYRVHASSSVPRPGRR